MPELMLTILVFMLVFAAMSIGVLLNSRKIQGSCGALSQLFGQTDGGCGSCANRSRCKQRSQQ